LTEAGKGEVGPFTLATLSCDMETVPGEIDLSMDDSDNDSVIIEENVQE